MGAALCTKSPTPTGTLYSRLLPLWTERIRDNNADDDNNNNNSNNNINNNNDNKRHQMNGKATSRQFLRPIQSAQTFNPPSLFHLCFGQLLLRLIITLTSSYSTWTSSCLRDTFTWNSFWPFQLRLGLLKCTRNCCLHYSRVDRSLHEHFWMFPFWLVHKWW